MDKPIAANKIDVNPKNSVYPEPFSLMMEGRVKRKLGDYFNITNYGVNLTELSPGAMSALKHHHLKQDEFIYILNGTPTLIIGNDECLMNPDDCFGVKKGLGVGHQLVNKSDNSVAYLEIGDRTLGDKVEYPDNDLCAKMDNNGSWSFSHKDGSPY